ncbi:hypothetical protein CBM2589_A90372 [Cupriavidus taiwanensis]|uniref:Uncharacterized protein n=1 Tax=Cupriavidus taiwanensis TaxID=164546 RepID=A0A375CFL5_9BURK|nr:hypothetical protein CBM2589_A90372 [Cupriavidus taiwanensis]
MKGSRFACRLHRRGRPVEAGGEGQGDPHRVAFPWSHASYRPDGLASPESFHVKQHSHH